ncbi:hypothetical protein [Neolewinella agarilytica]|nr:hypothetical protein [Neolewinella agarilytica]
MNNSPTSVICTLFEKQYHLGFAVLLNSLYANNFRGDIYAGYRGALPPWVSDIRKVSEGHDVFSVAEDLFVHFLKQADTGHMTNIKPDFMLELWEKYCPMAERLFYFDPDIVVKADWRHFEEWSDLGVAMVEDMNSPIPMSHPIRLKWKHFYAENGIRIVPKDDIYVNGGFVGVHRSYRAFLTRWKEVQTLMKRCIGSPLVIGIADRWNPFHYTDQDALNIVKDLYPSISIMEKGAMDFGKIGYVMSHAAGKKKPWTKNHLREILLNSVKPANTDKLYWKHTKTPVKVYSNLTYWRKHSAVRVSAMLGRVIGRS